MNLILSALFCRKVARQEEGTLVVVGGAPITVDGIGFPLLDGYGLLDACLCSCLFRGEPDSFQVDGPSRWPPNSNQVKTTSREFLQIHLINLGLIVL